MSFIKTAAGRIVTPPEHRTLIAHLKRTTNSERLYLLYLLVRYTGLRISEALSVTVGDVYDSTSHNVPNSLTVKCAKKGAQTKSRTVSLCSKNDKLRTELRNFLLTNRRTADPTAPLFITSTGAPWNRENASHELQKAVERAGLPRLSFHDLRRSYGTELYDQTRDMELVQAALGHEDFRTTRGYVQRPLAQLHQVNAALAAA